MRPSVNPCSRFCAVAFSSSLSSRFGCPPIARTIVPSALAPLPSSCLSPLPLFVSESPLWQGDVPSALSSSLLTVTSGLPCSLDRHQKWLLGADAPAAASAQQHILQLRRVISHAILSRRSSCGGGGGGGGSSSSNISREKLRDGAPWSLESAPTTPHGYEGSSNQSFRGNISSSSSGKDGGSGSSGSSVLMQTGVDWSFLQDSLASLKSFYRDLVFELLVPFDRKKKQKKGRGFPLGFLWYSKTAADVEAVYRQRNAAAAAAGGGAAATAKGSRFLIRGIIYEMTSLMMQLEKEAKAASGSGSANGELNQDLGKAPQAPLTPVHEEKLRRAKLAEQDWETFVLGAARRVPSGQGEADQASPNRAVTRGITVDEIADEMGLELLGKKLVAGTSRDAAARTSDAPAATVAGASRKTDFGDQPVGVVQMPSAATSKERDLQNLLDGGGGDGIRAKYAARLREKRMLAESRQEQRVLYPQQQQGGVGRRSGGLMLRHAAPVQGLVGGGMQRRRALEWTAMPGASGILRHFKERMLSQALVVTRSAADVQELMDQLAEFSFVPTLRWDGGDPSSNSSSNGAVLNAASVVTKLKAVCAEWKVQPQQVAVVLGSGPAAEAMLRALQSSPFYVCHLTAAGHLSRRLHAPGALSPGRSEVTDDSTTRYPGTSSEKARGSDADADLEEGKVVKGRGKDTSPHIWRHAESAASSRAADAPGASPADPSLAVSCASRNAEQRGEPDEGSGRVMEGDAQMSSVGGHAWGLGSGPGSGVEVLPRLSSWLHRLATDSDEERTEVEEASEAEVHCEVQDLLQLKGVVEELNGVSYRSSTFVRSRGF